MKFKPLTVTPHEIRRITSYNVCYTKLLRQLGTDGEKSSGLGLSVCKEFCDILQGKIEVESTEGLGSTFSFALPKYSEEHRELAGMKEKQATPTGH